MRELIMYNPNSEELNNKIIANLSADMINEVHKDLLSTSKNDIQNVYDFVHYYKNKEKKIDNTVSANNDHLLLNDYNLVLKLFLQEIVSKNNSQLKTHQEELLKVKICELKLFKTANEKFYKNDNNEYFLLAAGDFVKQDNIRKIFDDGSYIVKEKVEHSPYFLLKKLDKNNVILKFALTDEDEKLYKNLNLIVNILGLKKEYVKKFKKVGYFGNSRDLFANIANFFTKPIETGYYMDNKFNFYKWSFKESFFIRDNRDGYAIGSVSLADYETYGTNKIIRTDYDGKGFIQ